MSESLLNQATPAAGAAAPAAPAAAPAVAAPAAVAPAATTSDGEHANFTSESFATAMKNPEVLKDGKLFGKYTTFEEAGKGMKELAGKLTEKNPVAPETYDFSKVEVKVGNDTIKFDPNNPVSKAMMPVLKSLNIPQDKADILAKAFMEHEISMQIDPLKEVAALGDKGKAMLDNVKAYRDGKAPKEVQADIDLVTGTAAGVRLINHLLQGRTEGVIPVDAGATAEQKSSTEWYAEAQEYRKKNDKSIVSDKGQQDHYDGLMKKGAAAQLAEKKAKKG